MYRFARHAWVNRLKIKVYHANLRVYEIFVTQILEEEFLEPDMRMRGAPEENS
jgi:hypothetical protein